jgi:FlaA1/EpsC-like NDP-sugar epimerase
MSIQEAVDLIFKVTKMSCGGEIFILKMPVINIQDLVDVMIEKISHDYNYQQEDIKINIIGKRAGEKIYEELMIDDEVLNALEDEDLYIVLPRNAQITDDEYTIYQNYKRMKKNQYTSKDETLLTKNEIKALLQNTDL